MCYSDLGEPINPEAKKRYDREFLLGFQFSSASMHKPEGLPVISDVVLDEVCGSFSGVMSWLYSGKGFYCKGFYASINGGLDHCVVVLTALLSLINNQL